MSDPLGIVAAGHPATTQAAAEALRAGGNAFDAAIAAGFAATVAESVLTSLGGGGFLLAREADGKATLFDFFVNTPGLGRSARPEAPPDTNASHPAPSRDFEPVTVRFGGKDQVFHAGLAAAATPGTLAGLLAVHERLGRLDLNEVTAPAIHLARKGVVVNEVQAHLIELLPSILTRTEASRALYAPGDAKLRAGELHRNADLADFLEKLSASAEGFYRGELAARLAQDMNEGGGLLTHRDLAEYEVIEREPLEFTCGASGRALVLTSPAPSIGGPMVRISLELLAAANGRLAPGSRARVVALAAALAEAESAKRAQRPVEGTLPHHAADAALERILLATRGTTHISVIDREMNVASMTCSNGEGCGYIVPGTGIMLNNMLGEEDLIETGNWDFQPGVRMASMMTPTIVLWPQQPERILALGSGGSRRIHSAITQVISGVLDGHLSLAEAVERPRLHWEDGRLQVEPGLEDRVIAALRERFDVNEWERRSVYFGGVNAAAWPPAAAADSRRGGAAMMVSA